MKYENAPGKKCKAALWIKRSLLVALLMALLLLLFCWRLWQRAGYYVMRIFEAPSMDITGVAEDPVIRQYKFGMINGLHYDIGGAMIYSKGELGLDMYNCEELFRIDFRIDPENPRAIMPASVIALKPNYNPELRVPVPADAPVYGEAKPPPSPFKELRGREVILKCAGRYLSLPQAFYDEIESAMEQVDNGL